MQERIYPDLNQLFGMFVPPPMEPAASSANASQEQRDRQQAFWTQFEDMMGAFAGGQADPSAPHREGREMVNIEVK